jgi:endonuclease/exonuclease/phosphatase family metal-dependent hydrolase
MTYNVNFGLAGDDETIAAIVEGEADLVLLQETTPEWEDALRLELSGAYPHMSFHHSGGAGGLAVLSRFAFEERELVDSPSGWFPALVVDVDSPLGPLQVLEVHLRPPVSDSGSVVSGYFSTPAVRLDEIEAFDGHLAAGVPTIVAGDFNEREDGKAVSFLAGQGLASVLPEYHPHVKTWRWTTSVGEIEARLDHILYSPELRPYDARVVEAGRSDHLPVVAVFGLAPEGAPASGSSLH